MAERTVKNAGELTSGEITTVAHHSGVVSAVIDMGDLVRVTFVDGAQRLVHPLYKVSVVTK